MECLQNNFLHQLVDFSTRFREGQEPSLLDLIITADDAMISDISPNPPLGKSDHVVITFKLSCYRDYSQDEFVERYKYMYDKGDYKTMSDDLSKINWQEELNT